MFMTDTNRNRYLVNSHLINFFQVGISQDSHLCEYHYCKTILKLNEAELFT